MGFYRFLRRLTRRISTTFFFRSHLPADSEARDPLSVRILRPFPLLRFALYFAAGWWILAGNPFGVSTAADKAMSAEVNRITSFFTPVAQAPITVVLIDFESISGLHNDGAGWMAANDWPLMYADHANILKKLVSRPKEDQPTAIFYDIFFEHPRVISGDMERLGRSLSQIQAVSGVSIYLAAGGSYMPMSARSYDALQRPLLTPSAWQGYGDYYPLRAQLSNPARPSAIPRGTAPMPALALYKELCSARNESCHWTNEKALPAQAVQWEVQESTNCRARVDGTSYGPATSSLLRLARTLGISVDVPQPTGDCLPFHQVRLATLYGASPATLRPPGLAATEPFVVMVGVVMPSMKDYVPSPLYGQVEGIFLHAAALENLNRMGDGYIRDKSVVELALVAWGVAVIAVMLWCARPPKPDRVGIRGDPHRLWASRPMGKVLGVAVFAVLVLLIYFLLYHVFRISPEGWLGIIPLIPLMGEFVINYEKSVIKRLNFDHA